VSEPVSRNLKRNPKAVWDLVRKLPMYVRLVWALLRDPRVPPTRKGLLVLLAAYLVNPFDLIPDFIPIIGQLDDIAVTLLVLDVFIHSAPKEVVAEHLARISSNEDDLRKDLADAERLLGHTYVKLRDNLQAILKKGGGRFRSADEAASGIETWEEPQR
jgi:uncharacterized membrane protein YkvA (DUF1232 family)